MSNERKFNIVLLLVGILSLLGSLQIPYWSEFGPGSGFMPFWLAIAMILVSGFSIYKPGKSVEVEMPSGDNLIQLLIYVALVVVTIVITMVLGLVIALGIFALLEVRVIHRYAWWGSVTAALGVMVVVYLLFGVWLNVPLPTGIFGL